MLNLLYRGLDELQLARWLLGRRRRRERERRR
jgi:hypothetical protein